MICIVNAGKTIGKMIPTKYGHWNAIMDTTDWIGECTSTLNSHIGHLKHYFPKAEFIFVP